MTAREEIEVVAAEAGWVQAVPLQQFVMFMRNELFLLVECPDPAVPQWVRLFHGTKRWEVTASYAVLETALAWLRDPDPTVRAGLPSDPHAVLAARIMEYAATLDRYSQYGLIGSRAVADRLRHICCEAVTDGR